MEARKKRAASSDAYPLSAAGWGAAKSVTEVLLRHRTLTDGTRAIFKMNHENGGFDCPGCAWPDDIKGLKLDICENGIEHVTWEPPSVSAGTSSPPTRSPNSPAGTTPHWRTRGG